MSSLIIKFICLKILQKIKATEEEIYERLQQDRIFYTNSSDDRRENNTRLVHDNLPDLSLAASESSHSGV